MRYFINGFDVMVEREVSTPKQVALISEPFGYTKRIELSATSAQWKEFNLEQGVYQNSLDNTPFILAVANQIIIVESVNGLGEFTLDAPTGVYTIRTTNENVGNAEIEVVVA